MEFSNFRLSRRRSKIQSEFCHFCLLGRCDWMRAFNYFNFDFN